MMIVRISISAQFLAASGQDTYVRFGLGDSDSRAKFLPMQSRGVWVKGEKRVECGLRAA